MAVVGHQRSGILVEGGGWVADSEGKGGGAVDELGEAENGLLP